MRGDWILVELTRLNISLRQKNPRKNKGKTVFIILFLLPAFLLFTVFMVIPILFSFYYSLTEWDAVSPPEFMGMENYRNLIVDQDYWLTVKNTVILIILSFAIKIPISLILAYLMLKTRGFKILRTIYFLPVVIAPIAVGLMFSMFYNSEMGLINIVLKALGLSSWIQNWLSNPDIVLYSVSIPQVWQYIGVFFILLLTAMFAIPKELFENAEIDGASSTRIFFSIVLPLLRGILQVCLILAVVGSLKEFEHPWVITQGGPGWASSFVSVYMFSKSFISYQFGYGSAITISILIYALTFTVLLKKLSKSDSVEY
jgi:raffinose/stachyose/melibiose transport system permease protein